MRHLLNLSRKGFIRLMVVGWSSLTLLACVPGPEIKTEKGIVNEVFYSQCQDTVTVSIDGELYDFLSATPYKVGDILTLETTGEGFKKQILDVVSYVQK